jgi:hypothetical protein
MSRQNNRGKIARVSLVAIPSIAAILVAVLAIQQYGLGNSEAVGKNVCMTPEQFAAAAKYEVKKPTWVPDGFTVQCMRAEPFQSYIVYASGTLPTSDPWAAMEKHGAILIIIDDETLGGTVQPPPPEERVKQDTRLIPAERMQEMGARYLTINGYPAWVREAGDYGTITTQYSNGTIISVEKTHEPARLHLHIENTDYLITADRPSSILIRIAESIK